MRQLDQLRYPCRSKATWYTEAESENGRRIERRAESKMVKTGLVIHKQIDQEALYDIW